MVSDARDSWAMATGWDLLASSSIVVSAQIRFTFGFGFLLKVPSLLSVAHTVSAECDASLSAYFRLFPVFTGFFTVLPKILFALAKTQP